MKAFIRGIARYKGIFFINTFGLSLGMAVSIVVYLFVLDENSYDQYHENKDRIFRITHRRETNGQIVDRASTPLVLSTYVSEIESVVYSVRLLRERGGAWYYEDKIFNEPQFVFADTSIFDVFTFHMVKGSWSRNTRSGILMSESTAKKYFGSDDPIGRTVRYKNWGNEYLYEVAGVFEDMPTNSHFHFQILAPMEGPQNLWNDMHGKDWFFTGAWTYVLLKNPLQREAVASQFRHVVDTHAPEELKKATTFDLQPLTAIHLDSNLSGEIEANGDRSNMYMIGLTGIFILLLAAINFVNLSTARSTERAHEVGVRKVMGAVRSQLTRIFLMESVLTAIVSMVWSMVLAPLFLPFFNLITGKNIDWMLMFTPDMLLTVLGGTIVLGLLSGCYPALYLSSFGSARILRPAAQTAFGSHVGMRRGLVVLQFTVTLILMIGLVTISSQLNFITSKDLGFKKEDVVYLTGFDFARAGQLKTEIAGIAGVDEVATSFHLPGSQSSPFTRNLVRTDRANDNQRMEVFAAFADFDFLPFYRVELVAGRGFSMLTPTDTLESMIVNEAFVKRSGWNDGGIGRDAELYDMLGNSVGTKKIIGITKDFHFQSLRNEIMPVCFVSANRGTLLSMRLNPANYEETIAKAKAVAETYATDVSIVVQFLDDDMSTQYIKERRMNKMVHYLTVIAIVTSCIGLFELSSFAARRKTKEVAIRKVLGDTIGGVTYRFMKEFTILVVISFVIAAPVTYFLADRWLDGFVYHTNQQMLNYVLALAAVILLAWATVAYYSIKVGLTNPAITLKQE